MIFSKRKAYGEGIYFAKDAKYSDKGYAYNHGESIHGMFLASVLLGKILQVGKSFFEYGNRIDDIDMDGHCSLEVNKNPE